VAPFLISVIVTGTKLPVLPVYALALSTKFCALLPKGKKVPALRWLLMSVLTLSKCLTLRVSTLISSAVIVLASISAAVIVLAAI
jgi:hypothetical protein